jgi:16S rRNA (cytidine1402-2'-O)-methyltransferase
MLFLIPTTLGNSRLENVLPTGNFDVIKKLKYFVVENLRSARRFLKSIDKEINIDDLTFFELNQHTDLQTVSSFVKFLDSNDMGIISEAGCPCVADPGAVVVALAQEKGIIVVPLVGPSSILLSLMASGFNGQGFAFSGYLPIDKNARIQRLKTLENKVLTENQTQIFIETPYRNNQLFEDIVQNLKPTTKLCIASEITTANEFIKSSFISDWKKVKIDLHKKTVIFLIGK